MRRGRPKQPMPLANHFHPVQGASGTMVIGDDAAALAVMALGAATGATEAVGKLRRMVEQGSVASVLADTAARARQRTVTIMQPVYQYGLQGRTLQPCWLAYMTSMVHLHSGCRSQIRLRCAATAVPCGAHITKPFSSCTRISTWNLLQQLNCSRWPSSRPARRRMQRR